MDNYQINRNATGAFDVFRGTKKVASDLPSNAQASQFIIAAQNKQIYEDILRQAVRTEFLRATEDMEMDRERVLQIMAEEIAAIQTGRPKFIPTVRTFIAGE